MWISHDQSPVTGTEGPIEDLAPGVPSIGGFGQDPGLITRDGEHDIGIVGRRTQPPEALPGPEEDETRPSPVRRLQVAPLLSVRNSPAEVQAYSVDGEEGDMTTEP